MAGSYVFPAVWSFQNTTHMSHASLILISFQDTDYRTQTRPSSAIHIQVSKLLPPHTSSASSPAAAAAAAATSTDSVKRDNSKSYSWSILWCTIIVFRILVSLSMTWLVWSATNIQAYVCSLENMRQNVPSSSLWHYREVIPLVTIATSNKGPSSHF